MTTLDFVRLFRSILSEGADVDGAAIEKMGLLAVKIAQMYAVRVDLIGPEKCRELARLLQKTAPLPPAEFRRRFDQLAPPALKAELARLETDALASASLGQVHRATLKSGEDVVVKLARDEPREAFLADVRTFRRLVKTALFFYPKLERLADPRGALEAVERTTLTEMDFLEEKRGAETLQALARDAAERLPHLRSLHFPHVHAALSTPSLLVSEFIAGRTLGEWLDAGELPYEALLQLFRIHGWFLFIRGQFHGDLHPGNVIWRDGEFWFLDNANVESVPPEFGAGLFRMMLELGRGDYTAAARELGALSLTPLPAETFREFSSAFVRLYDGFAGKSVSEVSLTSQMTATIKLAVHSGLTFPRGAFPLIKSLMYLDGMVLRCAPNAVLLRDVAAFADDFA